MKFRAKEKKGIEIVRSIKSVDGIFEVQDILLCEELKNLGYEVIPEDVKETPKEETQVVEVPIVGTVSAEAPKKSKKKK